MRQSNRVVLVVLLCTAFATIARAQNDFPPPQLLDRITGHGIRAHMAFLADDLLEGRETGTRGYQLAANYVRAQFEQMGLEPAGDNDTYFQSIHFRKLTPQPERDSFVIQRPSGELKLAVEKNYLMAGDAAREDTWVEGGMVFVGYGVTAPERHYDDYAGVDVKGKIVVILANAPPSFPSSDRAFYSDDYFKARNAAAHGAIGAIGIWAGEESKNTPWEKIIDFNKQPIMFWLDAQGRPNDYVPEMRATAFVNQATANLIFQGSLHTFDEALERLERSQPRFFRSSAPPRCTKSRNTPSRTAPTSRPFCAAPIPR